MRRQKFKVLDLFSGAAGGWSFGLEQTGMFITVAACESDLWRREEFGLNHPGVKLYGDIKNLSAAQLSCDGIAVDVLAGSPPCQDASQANQRGKGLDGEGTGLFWEALRLVRELRPRWVLFENVPRLRTRGYDRIHDALEAADYAVWPLVVGAVHAGADHRRSRVWIVAHAEGDRLEGRSGAYREPKRPSEAAGGTDLLRSVWRHPFAGVCCLPNGVSMAPQDKRMIAAYGDAVMPQIAYAIGIAVGTLETSSSCREPMAKRDHKDE